MLETLLDFFSFLLTFNPNIWPEFVSEILAELFGKSIWSSFLAFVTKYSLNFIFELKFLKFSKYLHPPEISTILSSWKLLSSVISLFSTPLSVGEILVTLYNIFNIRVYLERYIENFTEIMESLHYTYEISLFLDGIIIILLTKIYCISWKDIKQTNLQVKLFKNQKFHTKTKILICSIQR
jgi:hypothetical protein